MEWNHLLFQSQRRKTCLTCAWYFSRYWRLEYHRLEGVQGLKSIKYRPTDRGILKARFYRYTRENFRSCKQKSENFICSFRQSLYDGRVPRESINSSIIQLRICKNLFPDLAGVTTSPQEVKIIPMKFSELHDILRPMKKWSSIIHSILFQKGIGSMDMIVQFVLLLSGTISSNMTGDRSSASPKFPDNEFSFPKEGIFDIICWVIS